MKYIIMCGGTYTAWKEPRQLLEIQGEPIVARTIRLLKENGVDSADIYISSNDPRVEDFAPVLYHTNRYEAYGHGANNGGWIDGFYMTDEPVTYLFGDVIFSPEAIRIIVETETPTIELFASAPPFAPNYPKPWAEPFALKVTATNYFRTCISACRNYQKQKLFQREPIMWELWQVITLHRLNEIDYNSYVPINDYTCDVDGPEDLEQIEEAMQR